MATGTPVRRRGGGTVGVGGREASSGAEEGEQHGAVAGETDDEALARALQREMNSMRPRPRRRAPGVST